MQWVIKLKNANDCFVFNELSFYGDFILANRAAFATIMVLHILQFLFFVHLAFLFLARLKPLDVWEAEKKSC